MFTCLRCETNFEIEEDVEPDDIVECPHGVPERLHDVFDADDRLVHCGFLSPTSIPDRSQTRLREADPVSEHYCSLRLTDWSGVSEFSTELTAFSSGSHLNPTIVCDAVRDKAGVP